MLKDTNYLNIQGWMINKLNLKGSSLIVYAIIYGFSQDDGSEYQGSLQYLQDWTHCTRQNIINVLKRLVEDNLIIKRSSFPNNIYTVNKEIIHGFNCKQNLHSNELDCKQNLQDSKLSLQNNNINNNILSISKDIDNIDISSSTHSLEENKYIQTKEQSEKIEEIVKYMNSVFGTHFKSSSSGTKRHIKARIRDVIDSKWLEWGVKPVKFSNGQMSNTYLRPSTLFGNHFEEYLQAAWLTQANNSNKVESVEKSTERSTIKF